MKPFVCKCGRDFVSEATRDLHLDLGNCQKPRRRAESVSAPDALVSDAKGKSSKGREPSDRDVTLSAPRPGGGASVIVWPTLTGIDPFEAIAE